MGGLGSETQPAQNFFRESIRLTLNEQQYFDWDNASQSKKWQDMLEIWGEGMGSLATWPRLCLGAGNSSGSFTPGQH